MSRLWLTHGRTWESRAVFCLSRIRNYHRQVREKTQRSSYESSCSSTLQSNNKVIKWIWLLDLFIAFLLISPNNSPISFPPRALPQEKEKILSDKTILPQLLLTGLFQNCCNRREFRTKTLQRCGWQCQLADKDKYFNFFLVKILRSTYDTIFPAP